MDSEQQSRDIRRIQLLDSIGVDRSTAVMWTQPGVVEQVRGSSRARVGL